MKECLNTRRGNTYETQIHEPQGLKEKLPPGDKSPQEKSTPDSNERRRKTLTRKEKRIRAIMRGDTLWTPGCGEILSIRHK